MNAIDIKPNWAPKPYTQGQADLIKTMMGERGVSTETLLKVFPSRPATFQDGKKVIEWLRGIPRSDKQASPTSSPQEWEDVPDGNYAYEYKGKTHFYRVSRRQGQGKYTGRTFIKVQERAGNDLYRMDWGPSLAVLKTIRKLGATECGMLFGEKLNKCRFCFSDLTDEDNPYKDRFAGPDCGPKYLG